MALAELDSLLDEVRRDRGTRAETVDDLQAAIDDWRRPVTIQITGRAGAGRTSVATALGLPPTVETAPVDAPDAAAPVLDGDIVVYVVPDAPQPADTRTLAALEPSRTLVVLNKADAIGPAWSAALARANEYTNTVRIQTVPMVAALAARTRESGPTVAELRAVATLAASGDPSITLSPDLFLAADVVVDVPTRRALLAGWELFGLDCAIDALRRDPGLDTKQILQILHAASGADAVRGALKVRAERASARRGGVFLDALHRLAARNTPESGSRARDAIERFLRGDVAAKIGLAAGLADPAVVDHAVEIDSARPRDAAHALAVAQQWRSVADGDIAPAAQRAALRIHHGYVREWARLRGGG